MPSDAGQAFVFFLSARIDYMMFVHIGLLLVVAVLAIVFVVIVDGARLVSSNVSLVLAAVMHVAALIMVSVFCIASRSNIASMGLGGLFQSKVCVGGLAARRSGGGKAFHLETG